MGKLRSGLREWGQGVAQLVRRKVNAVMRAAKKSPMSRLVPGSQSFMATDQTEPESEALLLVLFGALFAGIVAARLGILLQFLVGLAIGGALMAAWGRMMERRSRQREAIAANLALLGEASTGYIGYERVECLNKLLNKAWPHVVSATEDAGPTIRDFLEPLLEEYRLGTYQVIREYPDVQRIEKYFPGEEVITCLHVNAISLGTTAPTIHGLKIYPLKDGKIICNVRVEWQSDARITLGVGTDTGIVPIILESLEILATVRITLRITESPPFVAAIVATILDERQTTPMVDFTLTVVESSAPVPKVVTKRLGNLVTNFIQDTFLWPHRVVLPIIPSSKGLDLTELYLRLHGQLSVEVIKGENLVNLYPYVIIYCRPKFKVRTRSIENTHDPTWNEEFILDVQDQKTQSVIFQVMNENKGDDEHLGTVAYPLKDLALDRDVLLLLDVQPRKKKKKSQSDEGVEEERETYGSLLVELRYHVYTDLEREAAMKAEEELIKALANPDEPSSYTTAMDLIHPY